MKKYWTLEILTEVRVRPTLKGKNGKHSGRFYYRSAAVFDRNGKEIQRVDVDELKKKKIAHHGAARPNSRSYYMKNNQNNICIYFLEIKQKSVYAHIFILHRATMAIKAARERINLCANTIQFHSLSSLNSK